MDTLKDVLVARLQRVPGVRHVVDPAREDGFSVLCLGDREIGHFHDDHELDLRLGRTLIRKLGLVAPAEARVHPHRRPGSAYIELRVRRPEDVARVVRIVGLLVRHLAG